MPPPAHQRAKPQAVVGKLNVPKTRAMQGIDVDHGIGPHDVELHQVDQCSAAGEVAAIALRKSGRSVDGFTWVCCTFIGKRSHDYSLLAVFITSFACFMALTMLGYAAQRQRLPLMYWQISTSLLACPSFTQATADMICPGVQYPH